MKILTPYGIGQILGFVIAIYGFCIFLIKKRPHILLAKLIADVLNVIQQILIGAYTGAMVNVITVFREAVFYHRGRKKWADHWAWLAVFLVATTAASLLSWMGPISLLPMVGSMFGTVAFYCKKPTYTRIFGICSHSLWLIYCVFMLNYGSILGNAVLIVSAVIGLIRDIMHAKKNRSSEITR